MRVIVEEEPPLSPSEVPKVVQASLRIAESIGLNPRAPEIIYVYGANSEYGLAGRYIRVCEGAYVDRGGLGVIAVRGGVMLNVFLEEVLHAVLALCYIDTYLSLDAEAVSSIARKYFMRLLTMLSM